MKKFAAWFTTERRQSIQIFAASLAPLLILFGIGTEGTWEQVLILVGAGLQFVSNLLSLVNLRVGDWGKAYAVVRGAIYTLGLAAAPALVALGVISQEHADTALLGISLALATLGNLVSILTSSHQEQKELQA